jgi:DNA-binding NarL/FixJ family response regulator
LSTASPSMLVVDDFEPFRQFVCSMLQQAWQPDVVWEAADGLEAVQQAERLRPNLILLDVGLPKVNGIEAARRIRTLSPESRILFLSQTSDADVVQEALSLGAHGYVLKSQVGSDLRAAVEAVLRGERFVSKGLKHNSANSPAATGSEDIGCKPGVPLSAAREGGVTRWHEAHFYSDDASLLVGFTSFIETALTAGKAVIVIASESHREGLLRRLRLRGTDVNAAIEQGRYIPLDVDETFSKFMVNDLPDPVRFFRAAHECIAGTAQTASGEHIRVAACGEGTSILWAQGKADAGVQLERLWDDLAKTYDLDILCGYLLTHLQREQENETHSKICAAHSVVCSQ